ncbi:hypothetical protein F4083_02215 [Candidatus Poribacteria bacterium]|nr:hypothetical protein [Candidatus Poribacteria bacterium]MYB64280.1 hypothetical protein [Candidatus Poribacteria bacterium]MYF54403.1 hypothetical protein [Candidatus Poribacteria bacterium]MYI93126.1 hypothetical protein [Candidatus Poribacteria bacterium]
MQRYLKWILAITVVIATFQLHYSIEAEELLRWKNGDSLAGKLLKSNSGKIRWQSPYFSDALEIDKSVLDSIVFSKETESSQGTFRIATVSGDVWTADIIDSDENTYLFSNKRFGKFRVNRSSIYSLESREHSNLLFDGSQLSSWEEPQTGWYANQAGHPQTDKSKANIFYGIAWPERFEISLELGSTSRPPGFVFSLGKNLYEALRLETWVNELVVVQGTIFEPIMTIEPDRRNFSLRLAYDQTTGMLEIFDINGNPLLELKNVSPTVNTTGIYIYNRGQELTVRRLRVYRQHAKFRNQKVDFSKQRVHMMNGEVFHGKLFVDRLKRGKGYVLDTDGERSEISLDQIDRVVQPGMVLSTTDDVSTLSYVDGGVVQGEILDLTATGAVLKTDYADEPLTCSLDGASLLRFNSTTNSEKPTEDYDRMFFPDGSLQGKIIFGSKNEFSITWQPTGVSAPVRFADERSPRIERHSKRVSRLQPYDVTLYPHLLHLKNGEVIPCNVLSYDKDNINFRSPFISAARIASTHMKAIEFSLGKTQGRKENRNPITITGGNKHRIILEDGRILEATMQKAENGMLQIIVETGDAGENPLKVTFGGDFAANQAVALKHGVDLLFDPLEIQPEKLDVKVERALTIPRFNRENPPKHILVANNGDLKRGKLTGFNGETIQFEAKMRKSIIPLNRVARIIDISDVQATEREDPSDEIPSDEIATDQDPISSPADNSESNVSLVRIALIHNPILIFEPIEVRGERLYGNSSIYGEISIPVNSIQYLHFGEKAKSFKSVFSEWVVRPAIEPEYGENR